MKSGNIVLIGFMGVGKGTVARALAAQSGMFALDCDDMIESYANKKIGQIFKEQGEESFRKMEAGLAKFLEKSVRHAVISTGGGFYAVKNLNKIGTVVYLKSSFEGIINRLKNSENAEKKFAKRPLLADLQKAAALHAQRNGAYEKKADIVIDVENKSVKKIVKEICSACDGLNLKGKKMSKQKCSGGGKNSEPHGKEGKNDKLKKKEALKQKLRELIEGLEREQIPKRVIAWHFDLYEPYALQLAGSSSYDADDDDWACEDEDEFYPQSSRLQLEFLNELSWRQVLKMLVQALRELREQMPDAKIFECKHIAVGFVDGDLILI